MFAGVGPFSILIAKRLRDVEVHAVDSNQEAARLLEENVKLNMPTGTIRVWTGDARRVIEENLRKKASRVIMNHPSAAREFVDAACMAMQANGGWLHYYTFAEGLDYATKAEQELGDALSSCGWKMNQKISTRAVRGVAPMTWQVAIDATVAPA
jgi:tRNA (guanine37-N1)-methyltransferase